MVLRCPQPSEAMRASSAATSGEPGIVARLAKRDEKVIGSASTSATVSRREMKYMPVGRW